MARAQTVALTAAAAPLIKLRLLNEEAMKSVIANFLH
jgi:hypothetical protein